MHAPLEELYLAVQLIRVRIDPFVSVALLTEISCHASRPGELPFCSKDFLKPSTILHHLLRDRSSRSNAAGKWIQKYTAQIYRRGEVSTRRKAYEASSSDGLQHSSDTRFRELASTGSMKFSSISTVTRCFQT